MENSVDHQYNVQVGHWRVQVPAKNNADAIEQARKQLCLDLPRLWDVITKLTVDRFIVELA